MSKHTPDLATTDKCPAQGQIGQRRRSAADTRLLLLDAARHRFARDGYAATTVRDIADAAGVNVALINRYFTSKEGLFEACLTGAVDALGRTVADDMPLAEVPHAIARQLAGPHPDGYPNRLMLLLRSSGDERADRIRRDVLNSFAERLAAVAQRERGDTRGEPPLLEAQLVLAAAFGIIILRASPALEPLASANEQDLLDPIRHLVEALLPGN